MLTLRKNGHLWIFAYSDEVRAEIIGEFSRLAADPDIDFDWIDAARLSFMIGRELEIEISQLVNENNE